MYTPCINGTSLRGLTPEASMSKSILEILGRRSVITSALSALALVLVATPLAAQATPAEQEGRSLRIGIIGSGAMGGLVQYDDAQGIGRRYRRQDEVGTPLCVTVDFDSLDDNAVTIRERDSMAQVRVPIAELVQELKVRLGR